jgi:hypothetical protein
MASKDSLEMNSLAAKGDVRAVKTDTPIAIRLKHIGTGAITSVTVTTATNIVMVSDGYTQTYPFAAGLTYNTVGKLVDAINGGACTEAAGGQLWEAKVLDSLRSLATTSQFIDGAITAGTEDGVTYYDLKVDTTAADYFAVRLTYDRGFDKANVKKNHRVHLQEIKYSVNSATPAVDGIKIYRTNAGDETLVTQYLNVDTTETTINFASGEGKLTANYGEDIVVLHKDGSAYADVAGDYVQVVGVIE